MVRRLKHRVSLGSPAYQGHSPGHLTPGLMPLTGEPHRLSQGWGGGEGVVAVPWDSLPIPCPFGAHLGPSRCQR